MSGAQQSERPGGRQGLHRPGSPRRRKGAPKTQPPLRAFVVQEEYEGTGDVYYGRHAIVARRMGANEHNSGELHGTTCRRAPWADAYAPGPCPKLVMIAQGWWFECSGCGAEIREDAEPDDESRVSNRYAIEIGEQVYCSPRCRHRHLRAQSQKKTLALRAAQRLRDDLWRLVPGVRFESEHAYVNHVDGKLKVIECRVDFTFPGSMHGRGAYRFNQKTPEAELTVPYGDLAAWEAWRASTKKAKVT